MNDQPSGCATCPHASSRFDGGRGATTCALMSETIVALGPAKPTTRPSSCPLDARHLDAPRAVTGTAACPSCGWELRWLVAHGDHGIIEDGDIVVTPMRLAVVTTDGRTVATTTRVAGSPSVVHVPGSATDHVLLRAMQDGHVYAVERKERRAAVCVDPCTSTPAPGPAEASRLRPA